MVFVCRHRGGAKRHPLGIPATGRLIAFPAAHHRLAWGDGNGRVALLQSQAAMIRSAFPRKGP